MSECAENQARLQRNLMFLAAIADTQPQLPTMRSQPGMLYMRHQQAQPSTTQSLMAAQSSMLYAQAPALQQHQTLHLMMGSGGNNGPAASYVDSSLNPNVNESFQMASRVTVASKNEVAGNETSPGRQGGYPTGNYGSGGNFPLYSKVDGEDN
ncbi:hypothetical protein Sjap_008315 [Stephania japonica]|uniref:Uncharacterized protein n=1 Tax=Stephania japonica TaxID=461633 RepID=A0AAP0JP95_9MAGN